MAHKKAGGSKARQGGNVSGKRLGIKIYGGQTALEGAIILRQRGRTFVAGENVQMGRDFTLFAKRAGEVVFRWLTRKKKKVEVLPSKTS